MRPYGVGSVMPGERGVGLRRGELSQVDPRAVHHRHGHDAVQRDHGPGNEGAQQVVSGGGSSTVGRRREAAWERLDGRSGEGLAATDELPPVPRSVRVWRQPLRPAAPSHIVATFDRTGTTRRRP